MLKEKVWDSLVITCSDNESALAFEKECAIRQSNFLIHPHTTVLSVVDPAPNIGSGGATINAIIHVTEYISALEGYTVISSDVLRNKRILILHMGTTTPYSACSPGFLPVPATVTSCDEHGTRMESTATQFDILLHMTINRLAADSPAGFWVCSCDRLISVPNDIKVDWSGDDGVYLFTVPVEINIAANRHGVVKLDAKGQIEDIIYKGSSEIISDCIIEDGKVPVVSGVVFLGTTVVESLLNVSVFPPLVLWTYLGVDSGTETFQQRYLASEEQGIYRTDSKNILLSLFFDVLLCMSSTVKKNEFVNGQRSGVYGTVHFPDLDTVDVNLRSNAREVLWEALNEFSMKGVVLNDSEFHYISHDPSLIHKLLLKYPHHETIQSERNISIRFSQNVSFLNIEEVEDYVTVNSMVPRSKVGKDTIVLNSLITGNISIGKNSLLINLCPEDFKDVISDRQQFSLPDNLVVESLFLNFDQMTDMSENTKRVLLMFGINDKFQTSREMEDSTLFNESWTSFFERTGISPEEVWDPKIPKNKQCLLNAKLFPVYYPRNQMSILPLLWLQGSNKNSNMALLWRSSWRMSFKEILDLCSATEEFAWRTRLHFEIGKQELEEALKKKMAICFVPFFNMCVKYGYFQNVLEVLDNGKYHQLL